MPNMKKLAKNKNIYGINSMTFDYENIRIIETEGFSHRSGVCNSP